MTDPEASTEPSLDPAAKPDRDEAARLKTRALLSLARALADQRGEPKTWLASASRADMLAYIYDGERRAPTPTPQSDPVAAIESGIRAALSSVSFGLGEERVRKIVAEAEERMIERLGEALDGAAAPVQVALPSGEPLGPAVNGAHRALRQVVEHVALGDVMLVGPAGSGKTSVAIDCARALGMEDSIEIVGCDETQSLADLVGYLLPSGEWVDGPVTRAMRGGCLLVLDEVDNGNANTLNGLNAVLSHRLLNTARGTVRAAQGFRVVMTANTYGTGADWLYAGRNTLDAAFLDRFCGFVLYVDYDVSAERRIVGCLGDAADDVARVIWAIRDRVAAAGIARPVGTRWFVAAAKLATLHKGLSTPAHRERFVRHVMLPWSAEERDKALDGVDF